MTRAATWKGFDYRTGEDVQMTRAEWRQIINDAHHTRRIGGDLLIFTTGNGNDNVPGLSHEIYDKEENVSDDQQGNLSPG